MVPRNRAAADRPKVQSRKCAQPRWPGGARRRDMVRACVTSCGCRKRISTCTLRVRSGPRLLRQLGSTHEVPVPSATQVTDSASFFKINEAVRDCLRTESDFHRVAVEFCEDEALEGARYAEVTFTAAAHGERLGDMSMPLRAVLEGLAEGQARYGLQTRVVLDHSRRRSVERAWATLRLAEAYAGEGVIAVGLAGTSPTPAIRSSRSSARLAMPDCMWSIMRGRPRDHRASGRPLRRAAPSGSATASASLTIRAWWPRSRNDASAGGLPSSNLLLGLVASLADHPLPRLRSAGLGITVNTDIPAITGSGLAGEYRLLRETFGYSDAVLAELAHNAVAVSFVRRSSRASCTPA